MWIPPGPGHGAHVDRWRSVSITTASFTTAPLSFTPSRSSISPSPPPFLPVRRPWTPPFTTPGRHVGDDTQMALRKSRVWPRPMAGEVTGRHGLRPTPASRRHLIGLLSRLALISRRYVAARGQASPCSDLGEHAS